LVELMVVVTIIALGLTLAAPGVSQMVASYRVRAAAESILAGLNYARVEAVRRNAAVSFALRPGGSGWVVSQVSPSATLQSRSGNDSAGTAALSDSAATAVTFLPTGLLQSGSQMAQVTVSSGADGSRTRRVNIFGGGLIRMCDPSVVAAADPRKC
jgi:type IV fimbrial biogenesis protein FimT